MARGGAYRVLVIFKVSKFSMRSSTRCMETQHRIQQPGGGGGHKKHEIYVAILFYHLFLRG